MLETLNGFRPPQTPENSIISASTFSEGDGPATAEFVSNLLVQRRHYQATEQSLAITETSDRISPVVEAPEPIKIPSLDHQKDLKGIQRILRWFQDGGVMLSNKITNYELAPARWAALEASSTDSIDTFKQHEIRQVETALGERYGVAESPIIYQIDDSNRLRNEIYPKEPFAQGMQRGVAYLKEKGSPDGEREQKEVEGFLKIEAVLTDPEIAIGTKMIVCSPPSQLEGSNYFKNFVDCYEKTDQKVVTMTRFATDATYGEGFTDAYALSHPDLYEATDLRSGQEIVAEKYGLAKNVVTVKERDSILEGSKERIQFYIDTLSNPNASPESIFVAFQAVLNGADRIARGFKSIVQTVFKGVKKEFNNLPTFKNIAEEVRYWGHLPVELVKAACGTSGGGALKGIKGAMRSIGQLIKGGIDKMFKSKNGCSKCGRMGLELECGVCDNCKTE